MAEVAGLVIGGMGLVSLVDACMKSFELFESGTNYTREMQMAMLKLQLLHLRLSRWTETVMFQDDNRTLQSLAPIASSEEVDTVRKILTEVVATFDAAQKFAERYLPNEPLDEPPDEPSEDPPNPALDELSRNVQKLALTRRKNRRFQDKMRWHIRDRKRLNDLIESLEKQIRMLEELFPTTQIQQDLVAISDARELVQAKDDEGSSEAQQALADASAEVDKKMKDAIDDIASRPEDPRTAIGSEPAIFVGDYIMNGYQGRHGHHYYSNLNVEGRVKVHYGNNYGGKSIFDD